MKNKILALLAFLMSSVALASPITVDVISAPQGLTLQNQNATLTFPTSYVTESVITQSGLNSNNLAKQARGIYDFSVSGGVTSQNIALNLNLPVNAIIRQVWLDVITQPTGFASPTVGISCQSGADIYADTAIASLTTGQKEGKVNRFAGTTSFIKLTAGTGCYVNVKTGTLTAGKFAIFADYMLSQ